jgi:3-oxoacyl-[acyl-carrier protein] reductase
MGFVSDVVIVTGAASGLGAVYCRELSAAGYTVVGADVASVERVVDLGVSVDVTDREATERLAENVLERFGRIDALVNNAAVYSTIVKKPFEDISDDEWDRVLDVNVKGVWLCTRAVAPAMRRQRRGKIVNVSSMTVPTAPPGLAHYVASKAAVVGLTRALARELGPDGICVNTLTPDYIAFDRDYDNRQQDMAPALAAQRVFAREQTPEDMVGALLFLVGRGSDFVTGQNIWVNGGRAFN